MEVLVVLAVIAAALVLTIAVVALKVLIALVLLPFKLLGALLGIGTKIGLVFGLLGLTLLGIVLLPILLPLAFFVLLAALLVC